MINAGLINPPSSVISFREVTMLLSVTLNFPILIEAEKEFVGDYYYWLKRLGGMDFVDDFVRPGSELGCRIDSEYRFPNTAIVVNEIVSDNVMMIAGSVKFFCGKFDE
jgi:hypothetical protein